jgi:hypothetical protein
MTYRNFFITLISVDESNMKISIHKTKTMAISKEPMRGKLEIDVRMIEEVKKFN